VGIGRKPDTSTKASAAPQHADERQCSVKIDKTDPGSVNKRAEWRRSSGGSCSLLLWSRDPDNHPGALVIVAGA
jgi:hypothetical protein